MDNLLQEALHWVVHDLPWAIWLPSLQIDAAFSTSALPSHRALTEPRDVRWGTGCLGLRGCVFEAPTLQRKVAGLRVPALHESAPVDAE